MLLARRFVIVGAGVTGMFLAYYLRKEGHEVTLVDRDATGREASVYNAGLLTPSFAPVPHVRKRDILSAVALPRGPLSISLAQVLRDPSWFSIASRRGMSGFEEQTLRLGLLSIDLYREFLQTEKVSPDLVEGVLGLYRSAEDAESFARRFGGELLNRDEISGMGYRGLEGGVLLRREYSLNPAKLFASLRERVIQMGARLLVGSEALLKDAQGRVECVTEKGTLAADAVIVAAGAWTRMVCSGVGYHPQVLPARGLVLLYDTGGRTIVPRATLLEDYGVTASQHAGNTLRVAGFFEMAGFRKDFSRRRREWLVETLSRHVADLSGLKLIGEGVGFRPCTPDQLPIVGAVPKRDGLYVATGNCRLGLTLAPATAWLLKEALCDREPREPIWQLLSPSRFAS